MTNLFVPILVSGREKYEYSAISCGIFHSKENAVSSLVNYIIKNKFIDYDSFLEETYYYPDYGINILPEDEIVNTEEKFILYLVNHINGNYDILCDLCNKIGDTYYKDGWDFQIDTHALKI